MGDRTHVHVKVLHPRLVVFGILGVERLAFRCVRGCRDDIVTVHVWSLRGMEGGGGGFGDGDGDGDGGGGGDGGGVVVCGGKFFLW